MGALLGLEGCPGKSVGAEGVPWEVCWGWYAEAVGPGPLCFCGSEGGCLAPPPHTDQPPTLSPQVSLHPLPPVPGHTVVSPHCRLLAAVVETRPRAPLVSKGPGDPCCVTLALAFKAPPGLCLHVCAPRARRGVGCWAVLLCQGAGKSATCLPRGATVSTVPSQKDGHQRSLRGHFYFGVFRQHGAQGLRSRDTQVPSPSCQV